MVVFHSYVSLPEGLPLVRRMQNKHRLHGIHLLRCQEQLPCNGQQDQPAIDRKPPVFESHPMILRMTLKSHSFYWIKLTIHATPSVLIKNAMSVLCLLRQLRVQNFQLAKRLFSCIKVRPGSKGRFQGSRNGLKWGYPRSFIFMGFSIINHPFWGYPHFWKPP